MKTLCMSEGYSLAYITDNILKMNLIQVDILRIALTLVPLSVAELWYKEILYCYIEEYSR